MRTGHFDEYHFAPPDPAAAFLAEKDPLAVYEAGERKGQRKSAASIMWDFERGELPQGVFAPAQNIDGDEIDHDAWIEARRVHGVSVYDLERPATASTRTRKVAPARLLEGDEWNAILACMPMDFKDRGVLIASARHGKGAAAAIAKEVGICTKQVRNIQNKIVAQAAATLDPDEITAHLKDPITQEAVVRRAPSKAGRKPKGWVAVAPVTLEIKAEIKTAEIINLDLFGDPVLPRKHRGRKAATGARRPRLRPTVPGQMALFGMAA